MTLNDTCKSPETLPSSPACPLFLEPWWLDAVAPGNWDEIRLTHGGTLARLPFVVRWAHGSRHLGGAPLTQFLGPWYRIAEGKYSTRLSREHELQRELLERLPQFKSFHLRFAPEITNILPFYWAGFDAAPRYTYRLNLADDSDALWAQLRENIRREIRKALRTLIVRDDLSIGTFIQLNRSTFERQGLQARHSPELISRLDDACAVQGRRHMLFAEDGRGRVHAAVYLVWGNGVCYYLMSGTDAELRTSGALSLLLWNAITFAPQVATVFDFEGSMIRPIERFFRGFGARQVMSLQLSKTNASGLVPRMKALVSRFLP